MQPFFKFVLDRGVIFLNFCYVGGKLGTSGSQTELLLVQQRGTVLLIAKEKLTLMYFYSIWCLITCDVCHKQTVILGQRAPLWQRIPVMWLHSCILLLPLISSRKSQIVGCSQTVQTARIKRWQIKKENSFSCILKIVHCFWLR